MSKAVYVDEKTFRGSLGDGDSFEPTEALLRKQFVCDEIKVINEDNRTIDFIISTETVDRMGDTIAAKGWDLKAYKKNPVILFAHDSREPPIGRAIRIGTKGDKLIARAEFTPEDMNPFGYAIFQMYIGGFMKATSVGFRPIKFEQTEDEKRVGGIDFLKQELLEFSAVPVPANPEALIEARSAGIDTTPFKDWAERILDEWDDHKDLMIPRRTVIALQKHADRNGSTTISIETQNDLLAKNLQAARDSKPETPEMADKLENSPEDIEKAVRMTGVSNGHQHAYNDSEDGMTMITDGHKHTVSTMASPEGPMVTIGTESGHTHSPDPANISEGTTPGPYADVDPDIMKEDDDSDELVLADDDVKEILEKVVSGLEDDELDGDEKGEEPEEPVVDFSKILSTMIDDADAVLDAIGESTFKALLETRQGRRLLANAVSTLREMARAMDKMVKEADPEKEKENEDEITATDILPDKEADDPEVLFYIADGSQESEEKEETPLDTVEDITIEDVKAALAKVLPELIAEKVDETSRALLGIVD